MRALFVVGVLLLLLGIASLFIPIPVRQKHGFNAGGLSVGIETTEHQKVHPAVTAVLIGGGVLLMIVGGRGRR
jgi:hypothetical protein